MEPGYWQPSHCEALKEYVTKGMSYSDATRALNARFGTAYSRSAALGRARRMGLGEPVRPKPPPIPGEAELQRLSARRSADDCRPVEIRRCPVVERVEQVELRCVEVDPHHLALVDLEHGDCRFPYGGDADGEAITFCGHPRRKGSSYCAPHFHLTRNPIVAPQPNVSAAPQRNLSAAPLRLVDVV